MIKVNPEKCTLCGLCTKICHESCLKIENGALNIDYKYCSTCTQCVAVCPQKAITWNNIEPEEFNQTNYPESFQIEELLKERRTIRDYTNQKIERTLLEEITGIAIYAPTHDFNLRTIVIDEDELIEHIDNLIYKFSVNIYKWLYKPQIVHTLIRIIASGNEFEYLKAKPKLEKVKNRQHGFKTKPAAIILIIGNKGTPLSLESAQYAIYNIDLYAQSKGLACRNLVGNQMILNHSKDFKKMFRVGKKEKVFGAITIGYPAIKFKNKVVGKKINIQWNTKKS